MRIDRRRRALLVLLAVLACSTAACDTLMGDAPGIDVIVEADPPHLQRTVARAIQVRVERTDFEGEVALAVDDAPAGVTVTLEPAVVAAGSNEVVATLLASADAALGAGVVALRATADGVADAVSTVDVTVIVRGTYSLDPTPDSLVVYRLESGLVKLAVTREGGFYQPITYEVVESLEGVTVSFDVTDSDTTEVAIDVGGSAPTGTRTLGMRGRTEGLEDRHAAIRLTVEQRPALALLAQDTVEMELGSVSTYSVSLARTNFGGPVEVTAVDVPAGVTVSFDPATLSGEQQTSAMRIEVGTGAALGTATFVMQAVGEGLLATRPVTLVLRAAGSTG